MNASVPSSPSPFSTASPASAPAAPLHIVRVWDLPTRVFHWALALGIVGLVITGQIGGNAMVWHFRTGLGVLALLLFRLVWGLVGGRWSRFGAFIYSPRRLVSYIRGRGKPQDSVGHSPLGAASVFALLAVLLAQVGSGLFSDDEIAAAGPLTRFVSSTSVQLATNYHTNIGKWIILALVVLHIAAIGFYLCKKQNLIKPMLHGDKQLTIAMPASRDDATSRLGALVIFAVCVGFVVWLNRLAA